MNPSWYGHHSGTHQPTSVLFNILPSISVPQPVCRHKVSGVPRIFIGNCIFARYSQKKAISFVSLVIINRNTHTGSSSIVLCNIRNVLFSCACILTGQGFTCRYTIMAVYSFVPPFREATFCGVPSRVFDKLGGAAGEKRCGTLIYNPNTTLWTREMGATLGPLLALGPWVCVLTYLQKIYNFCNSFQNVKEKGTEVSYPHCTEWSIWRKANTAPPRASYYYSVCQKFTCFTMLHTAHNLRGDRYVKRVQNQWSIHRLTLSLAFKYRHTSGNFHFSNKSLTSQGQPVCLSPVSRSNY
jgi:hypothetical protein